MSRTIPPPGARPGPRTLLFGYSLYDFADSAFATTILSVLYNQYYASSVAAGQVRLFGSEVPGTTVYTWLISITMVLVVLSGPFLGALADRSGGRIRFLAYFWLPGVIATTLLATVDPGEWVWGGLLFFVAYFAFSGSSIFYNALLPEIASLEKLGRASGIAWGFGYLGGALLLVLNLIMLQKPELLGFAPGSLTVRHCFATVGIWWFVFTLPVLWIFRYEARRAGRPTASLASRVRDGIKQSRRTFRHLIHQTQLRRFFFAYLVYNDGVQTVVTMASIFGAEALGMKPAQLILFFLLIQGTAFVGAWALGWIADRWGHKQTLLFAVGAWAILTAWASQVGRLADPVTEFWFVGGFAGLFLGGIQSCSRSLVAHWIPEDRESEFFGFFSILSRVASVFGPGVYGALVWATGSLRFAILAVTLFFLVGGWLLWRVDPSKIEEEKAALKRLGMDDRVPG